jgi:hypothetical protein
MNPVFGEEANIFIGVGVGSYFIGFVMTPLAPLL